MGWLPALTGGATSTAGWLKLIRGDIELLTAGLLVVGLGSLLSICLYVFFQKSRIDTKHPAYGKKTRRFALVGLFAVTTLIVLSGGGWHYQQSRLENPVVVLVADFKNLQPKNRGVTEEIISQLREATAEYVDVKIQALNESITEQEGSVIARAKGKKRHADIVLWGWYDETKTNIKVTVNFENLENLRDLSERQKKSLIQPIANIESFKIQTQLSEEMSYLTLLTLGLVRFEAKDYDGAIARFTRALKTAPDSEQEIQEQDAALYALYFYRGRAYHHKGTTYKIGGYDKTVKAHVRSIDSSNLNNTYIGNRELDKAIQDYTHALKLNPKYANAYINRGFVYQEKGDIDKAIADYTQALQIDAKDALAYNNRGLAYSKKGELDQALADYNRALAINAEYVLAYNNRGSAYADKGKLDEAIADYNQALKINPKYAPAYHNRGIVYKDKRELDKAIIDFSQALEIDSEYADAYISRGNAYKDKGELDKAIADYTQALKINPKYALAYNNRGVAYSDKGELNKAIADYNRALAINPKDAGTYYNRGKASYEKGELDKAIIDFNQALEINAQYADAYIMRGLAYKNTGELDKAISDYNRVLKINPEYAGAYYSRGEVYAAKGKLDKAITDYNKALEIDAKAAYAYHSRGKVYIKLGDNKKAIQDLKKAAKLYAEKRETVERQKVLELLNQL